MFSVLLALTVGVQRPPTTPLPEPAAKPKQAATAPPRKTQSVVRPPPIPAPVAFTYVDKPTGAGEPATNGELVTIHFLVKKQGGIQVADSKRRGLPYTFKLGDKGNDPLLNLVVKGMRPGATRVANVLAKDAYGDKGVPNLISPGDRLVVVITLLHRGGP